MHEWWAQWYSPCLGPCWHLEKVLGSNPTGGCTGEIKLSLVCAFELSLSLSLSFRAWLWKVSQQQPCQFGSVICVPKRDNNQMSPPIWRGTFTCLEPSSLAYGLKPMLVGYWILKNIHQVGYLKFFISPRDRISSNPNFAYF